MPTLGDMAALGATEPNDRDAYLSYVEACQLANKVAFNFTQWKAAGKPKG